MKQRGICEKLLGSDVWRIRYVDAQGRYRHEKAGSMAIDLYRKRKTEALQGKKLPERLRRRVVPFSELGDDALQYGKANERHVNEIYRIKALKEQWNRMRTAPFGIYRLGIENGKVQFNPAKPLKRRKVSGGRVRFLNQFEPPGTEVDYLKPLKTEEERLRAVIKHDYRNTSRNWGLLCTLACAAANSIGASTGVR